jgi:mannose-6-phosphate isomerase
MKKDTKVFKLQGTVQPYAWGGAEYIPALLSVENNKRVPFAEYWLGAHAGGSALLEEVDGGKDYLKFGLTRAGFLVKDVKDGFPLNEYLMEQPAERLGGYTAERFGRLPYLLKILDVKDMLSIQVHPTKAVAELEFAAENRRGVALNAPDRNYKDDNHKPELMTALSEFWLLHGFKPEEELQRILQDVPELGFLAPVFEKTGYQGLYKAVMEMPQAKVNEVLQPLLDRILPLYTEDRLSKNEEHFWAARAATTYNEAGRTDRGIFSIYLFNLLNLHPGEAVFQDAGLPHAYLEGQNVEIMANSDNVLRGGLTPKHVDVPELLKHVRFEATHPRIITGDKGAGHITVYSTPAPDFELSKIDLLPGEAMTIKAHSVEIFIVTGGRLGVIEQGGTPFSRKKGEAFVAFFQGKFELLAQEDTVVFRAAVPMG